MQDRAHPRAWNAGLLKRGIQVKPIPDCVPDALRLIIETAKAVSDEDFIHRKILLKVMADIAEEGDLGANPADLYLQCWEIACRALGVKDPYENEKARCDKVALGILKLLGERLDSSMDHLREAVKVSYAGAMLEYAGLGRDDLQHAVLKYLDTVPARNDMDSLLAAIHKAESVMLVANRGGEIALDKPLAEAMAAIGKKVYLTVAAKPVFLMATEKDAATAEFSADIHVATPGTAMYGLSQERSSSEFRSLFNAVDLVIVKGAIHFSAMAPRKDLYFILKAGQEEIAARLEIPQGGGAIVKMAV